MTYRTRVLSSALSRRSALKAGAAATALALSGFPLIARAQNREIVMNVPGGIYEQNFKAHVVEPFEKKSGKKVNLRFTASDVVLTSMLAQKDNPEYDIAFLSYPLAMKAITTRDIFIDLPVEIVPNARDLHPLFYDLYERKAAGFNFAPFGIGYNTDRVKPAPTSWQDLWRPELKGRVSVTDLGGGFAFETVVIAALINGGSIDNLEPGWEALKKLKPNVVRWYRSAPEGAQLMEREEAWVSTIASSRMYAVKDAGKPVDWVAPKEGTPVGVLSFHVARNSPNRDLAVEFANFALGKEPQEGFANGIEFGACNVKAELKGRAKDRVPPHEKLMRIDWPKLEPKMSAMAERWQREVVS